MGYSSRRGRRPDENASKSAHSYVINDPEVQRFLKHCNLPKKSADVSFADHGRIKFQPVGVNPIRHVIAVDGGYTEVVVEKEFPSSTLCFFQFGALIFGVEDLEHIDRSPFIDPDDIAKLKHIQRLKLTLPTRNITVPPCGSMIDSVRMSIHNFLSQTPKIRVLTRHSSGLYSRNMTLQRPSGYWRAAQILCAEHREFRFPDLKSRNDTPSSVTSVQKRSFLPMFLGYTRPSTTNWALVEY